MKSWMDNLRPHILAFVRDISNYCKLPLLANIISYYNHLLLLLITFVS